ncbi:alpha/beta fold hydrolase [Alteromonas sediminis]|uniref:Alpha/beta fold hydrolase n=1 Tax=Alteromonas sediminis TaxID=2259342 RepID=A0A3N5Y106_9ALTE|nr:alpha/beta hydrolase [Alteromonas sediminis]RPJ67222.1 alpha/beta fold hydrolase [Alteromonas sediminis]
MKKLIVIGYQMYFWLISRLLPRYASKKALLLIFTVGRKVKEHGQLKQADETIHLPSGAHLFKWNGDGSKSLLLLHGWNGSLTQFDSLFNHFIAQGYTIYGLSPAGFGPSKQRQSHPGLFIDAVTEAASCIPVSADVAIGHSMGGGALALAATKVKIAKQLVLISSPASFFNVLVRFSAVLKLGKRASDSFYHLVEHFIGRSHNALEVRDAVKALSLPTLLVHDEYDREVPFSDAEHLKRSAPLATLYNTQGLGHNRILNNENVVLKIVEQIEQTSLQNH